MPLTHDQALQQLHSWTTNPSLLGHARAVEIVMRAAASKCGGDPEIWGTTGLLHDADYDQWPEEHPKRIVDWLREQGEEDIAYAVSFHQTKWGLPPKSPMDKALLACDELTGFIINVPLNYWLAGFGVPGLSAGFGVFFRATLPHDGMAMLCGKLA